MAVVDQVGDDAAGRLARVAHAQDLTHLGQGQADCLGRPNERQAVNSVLAVRPISRLSAAWLGQQSELLVVAQRCGRHPALAGQFTDSHPRTIPELTFEHTRRSTLPTDSAAGDRHDDLYADHRRPARARSAQRSVER